LPPPAAAAAAAGGGNGSAQPAHHSATANLDHRVSEHRSRSEELVNDLLALTVADGSAGATRRGVGDGSGRVTSLSDGEDELGDGQRHDDEDDETEDDFM